MKRILIMFYQLLREFGIDPLKTARSIRAIPYYLQDLINIWIQKDKNDVSFQFGLPHLCLHQRFEESGTAKGHYFHQDLLVAQRIYLNRPRHHVDIGSRIDGFVAHVAAFREIEVIDIRPQNASVPNIKFTQANYMVPIDRGLWNYCDSISCLHALEHFGLGRYGDPIEYEGYHLGLKNLSRTVTPNGRLYLSVPIGPQRIEFNAHRVFSMAFLLDLLAAEHRIEQFSYVDDEGRLHEDVALTRDAVGRNCGCIYGCGIFELTKRKG